tara:strand:+ start:3613 stop:3774 length:162 start_codon:yes stop_codon:yes gene_type:complete
MVGGNPLKKPISVAPIINNEKKISSYCLSECVIYRSGYLGGVIIILKLMGIKI